MGVGLDGQMHKTEAILSGFKTLFSVPLLVHVSRSENLVMTWEAGED